MDWKMLAMTFVIAVVAGDRRRSPPRRGAPAR
jgi:hypothetical protein